MKKITSEKERNYIEDIYDVTYNNIVFKGFLKKMIEKINLKKNQSDKIIEDGAELFKELIIKRGMKMNAKAKTINIDFNKGNNIGVILEYLKNNLFPSFYHIFKNNKEILFKEKIFNILLKIILESFDYFINIIQKGMKEIENLQEKISESLKNSPEFESAKNEKKKKALSKQINQNRIIETNEFEEAKPLTYLSDEDKKKINDENIKRYIEILEEKYNQDENFISNLLNDEDNKQQTFNKYQSDLQSQFDEIQILNSKIQNFTQEISKLKKDMISQKNNLSKDNYKLQKKMMILMKKYLH